MKILCWIILLSIFFSGYVQAQQVTKVECCIDLGGKASIVINDNSNKTPLASTPVNTTTVNGGFDFKLDVSANTSAGVYNTAGILVRTLWNGVRYEAGCYSGKWDGYLDDGVTLAPLGSYTIKVLTNNVQYTWDGVVGNTSKDFSGKYIFKGELMEDLCFVGNKGFFANGYSEKQSSQKMFLTADEHRLANEIHTQTTQSSLRCCTDGNIIYWAGYGISNDGVNSWVYGAYPVDNANPNAGMVSFAGGHAVNIINSGSGNYSYTSGIAHVVGPDESNISGIDVQTNGNFLFVIRSGINQLQVLNKTTGVLAQTITLNNPLAIAAASNNKVWLIIANFPTLQYSFSQSGAPEHAGNKVFDGDFNSSFASTENPSSAYVQVDAIVSRTASVVKVAARQNGLNRLNGALIQSSANGVSWTTLAKVSGAQYGSFTSVPIPATTARYWRLYRNDGTNLDVAEVQFFTDVLTTTATQYAINPDGTLTQTGLAIPCGNDSKIDISPITSEIAIADNNTYQIKFFNGSTGMLNNTLGQVGGYINSPYAANNKFGKISFISYQPDGKLWIGDPECFRALRFNTNRIYDTQIAWLPNSRTITADSNNPIRVFSNFAEFEVDYSKPLDNGTNGSWKLKAMWAPSVNTTGGYPGFYSVITLSNGKTYAQPSSEFNYQWVELSNTGLRMTGVYDGGFLGRDGTLFYTTNIDNDHVTVYKKVLTGFNNSNPTWGNPIAFVSTPSGTVDNYSPGNPYEYNIGHTNNADKYIFFNHLSPPQNGNPDAITGYHLGAIKAGDNKYLWKASRSTRTDYYGNYPTNGDFDIGNGWPVQHSDTRAVIYDKDVFWNVNSEFWNTEKSNNPQNNIWNHFSDDGLLIGHFGITGEQASYIGYNAPGFAGNALTNQVVKVGNDYYIYHCDESVHAGIHRWHVTGLNTVATLSIPLTVSSAITTPADITYLMSDVQYANAYTGNQWSFSPSSFTANWLAKTNVLTYKKTSPDLYISSNQAIDHFATRSLGTNNTNNWTLTGKLAWPGAKSYRDANNARIQILDNTGKAIVNFTINSQYGFDYINKALFNDQTLLSTSDLGMRILTSYLSDFTIKCINGLMSIDYIGNTISSSSVFTPGANVLKPAKLLITLNGSSLAISVSELKFKVN